MLIEAFIEMKHPFTDHELAESAIETSLGFPKELMSWKSPAEFRNSAGVRVLLADEQGVSHDSTVVVYAIETVEEVEEIVQVHVGSNWVPDVYIGENGEEIIGAPVEEKIYDEQTVLKRVVTREERVVCFG